MDTGFHTIGVCGMPLLQKRTCRLCLPYVLGELCELDRVRFERHLRSCRRCQSESVNCRGLLHAVTVDFEAGVLAGRQRTPYRPCTTYQKPAQRWAAKAAQAQRAGRSRWTSPQRLRQIMAALSTVAVMALMAGHIPAVRMHAGEVRRSVVHDVRAGAERWSDLMGDRKFFLSGAIGGRTRL